MKKISKIFLLLALLMISASVYGQKKKFDRGISMFGETVFLPKNSILFGGTVSYQDYSFNDYTFVILSDINLNAYSLKVTPLIYYTIADNQAIGLRFAYKRSMIKLDELGLDVAGLDLSLGDVYNIQHSYYGSLAYRYYIPIGASLRFGIFTDISLNGGYGQGKLVMGSGTDITGTYQNILDVSLDVVPGLIVFMSNEVAIEASVGILGLGYKKVDQVKDQIYEGNYETSSANFKINFLSISLGVNIVLPV